MKRSKAKISTFDLISREKARIARTIKAYEKKYGALSLTDKVYNKEYAKTTRAAKALEHLQSLKASALKEALKTAAGKTIAQLQAEAKEEQRKLSKQDKEKYKREKQKQQRERKLETAQRKLEKLKQRQEAKPDKPLTKELTKLQESLQEKRDFYESKAKELGFENVRTDMPDIFFASRSKAEIERYLNNLKESIGKYNKLRAENVIHEINMAMGLYIPTVDDFRIKVANSNIAQAPPEVADVLLELKAIMNEETGSDREFYLVMTEMRERGFTFSDYEIRYMSASINVTLTDIAAKYSGNKKITEALDKLTIAIFDYNETEHFNE